MPDKKKVIVTELGGRIGKVLRDHLGDKYEFSGIDRIPLEGLDSLTSDLTDLDAITPAFEGKDIVVHLAAEPRHTPDIGWDLLMSDNVIATANVFEAAQAGVSRIIFYGASANAWKIYDTPRAWEVLGFKPQDNAESFSSELAMERLRHSRNQTIQSVMSSVLP